MQKIETSTQLNVDLQFELPTLIERVGAFFIDLFILIIAYGLIASYIFIAFANDENKTTYLLAIAPIFMLYSLYFEALNNGRTIGKVALGLRVIKLNGKPCTINDYLMRWIFRLLDIHLSAGSVAIIAINASNKGQRVGDFLAQTTVVKFRNEIKSKAENISNIKSFDNYKVTYPLAKEFSEEQMLLLKTALDRYKINGNEAHEKALMEIVIRINKKFKINSLPKDYVTFLKTVLNDYVVLTR
jgi:uncharacterized RDD family membrane protein YckC